MCGIAGLLYQEKEKDFPFLFEMEKMVNVLSHRGPDSSGIWQDENKKVFLGHSRLSILDLSEKGKQPMVSSCGRYVIVFNGEIYNHLEIRKKLDSLLSPINWKSTSDTETLLEAYSLLGIEECLSLLKGMFAFAIWDIENKELTISRDRLGEKPVYYGNYNGNFIFSSELKSIIGLNGFEKKISSDALSLFLKYSYIPGPLSIFEDIYKLPPGSFLKYQIEENTLAIKNYWDPLKNISSENKFNGTVEEAKKQLTDLLEEAVERQMISDVPLGAFLSGGIDSSLVVSIMQKKSKQKIKTFSIGFLEENYNEAEQAKEVSETLGTDHKEIYFKPNDVFQLIPELPDIYDEPFADASQLPTILLSRLAKSSVTVSLSGDGGDELFAGYNRHIWSSILGTFIKYFPHFIRKVISNVLVKFSKTELFNTFVYKNMKESFLEQKIRKFCKALQAKNIEELYSCLLSNDIEISKLLKSSLGDKTNENITYKSSHFHSTEDQVIYGDLVSYLPDDILVKVDRAAMSCSLETRVPFLDHKLVEYAISLPSEFKVKKRTGKWILKEILFGRVARQIVDKPKTGFSVPIEVWLKKDLKDWAENYLSKSFLNDQDIFNVPFVISIWNDHQSGIKDNSQIIWTILMFQLWYERWILQDS